MAFWQSEEAAGYSGAKLVDEVFLIRAGKEKSVAATKTYTGQLLIFYLLSAALQGGKGIENLQRIYGFYYDRAAWDQMADLFASKGTIEFAQQGVYAGRKRVRQFLGTLGHDGLTPGWFNDRMQLQIVADVSADGHWLTAFGARLFAW
jgi:hypothetical protein